MIIISGANGGIGNKIINFLPKGNKIVAIYFKNKPTIKNKNIKLAKIDFSKLNSINIFKSINFKNEKRITFLNLASIKTNKLSLNVSLNELKKNFAVNSLSYFVIIKQLLPIMIKNKWGRVINFSSTGGMRGDMGTLSYTSSKHSSLGMNKVFSKEYAKFNITFNTINLGSFKTGMYEKLNKKIQNKILKEIPSGKTGKFCNIRNAIRFIISSDYVNGTEINIDGGI